MLFAFPVNRILFGSITIKQIIHLVSSKDFRQMKPYMSDLVSKGEMETPRLLLVIIWWIRIDARIDLHRDFSIFIH